jgi:hypothetical protein
VFTFLCVAIEKDVHATGLVKQVRVEVSWAWSYYDCHIKNRRHSHTTVSSTLQCGPGSGAAGSVVVFGLQSSQPMYATCPFTLFLKSAKLFLLIDLGLMKCSQL